MKKRIYNGEPKRIKIEKPYTEYLQQAAERGQFTAEEVRFWSMVNKKIKKNPFFFPFTYLYRSTYRTGLKRRQIYS